MAGQPTPGQVDAVLRPDPDHVARHQVLATHVAPAPVLRLQAGAQHDLLQVLAVDVEPFAERGQRQVEVFLEAAAQAGRRIARATGAAAGTAAMRIAVTAQVVEQQRHQQHEGGIDADRPERKAIAQQLDGRAAEHRGQCHRSPRRMQAAQRQHGRGRQRPGQCGYRDAVAEQLCTADTDQRRDQVAAQDSPGLGQRTGRQQEQQHGRRPHRGDQPGVHLTQGLPAQPAGQPQAQADAQAAEPELPLPHRQGRRAAGPQAIPEPVHDSRAPADFSSAPRRDRRTRNGFAPPARRAPPAGA